MFKVLVGVKDGLACRYTWLAFNRRVDLQAAKTELKHGQK